MSTEPDGGEDFFDYATSAPDGQPAPQPFHPMPAPPQFYPAAAYPGPYFPQPAMPGPYPPQVFYPTPQGFPGNFGAQQPGALRNLDGSPAMPASAVRRPPPRRVSNEPSETELFDFLPQPLDRSVEEPKPEGKGLGAGVRQLAGRFKRQQLDPAQMTSDAHRLPDVDTDYEESHPTIVEDAVKPALYDLTQDFYVVGEGSGQQGSSVLVEPDGDPDARVLPLKEPLLDFGEPGEPAGISTWIVGGALAAASVTALVAGGPGACLFVIAEVSLLTAFYVMATSRMSWARIGGRRLAGAVMAGSVGVFMLGAALSPPSPDPVTVEKVTHTVESVIPSR